MVGEVGKAAGGFIDAMKAQPVALAMVAVIFALLALLYYQSALFAQQRTDNVKLFAQCITPPK